MDRTNSTGADDDIPSALSAILNEMRHDEIETEDGVIRLDGYADQIESGIRQIIDEWKAVARAQDKAQTVMMEEIERLRAPGSAAAMREALEYVLQFDATDEAAEEDGLTDAERIAEYADHIEECQKRARAALAMAKVDQK